jgi:hypothetical protein
LLGSLDSPDSLDSLTFIQQTTTSGSTRGFGEAGPLDCLRVRPRRTFAAVFSAGAIPDSPKVPGIV